MKLQSIDSLLTGIKRFDNINKEDYESIEFYLKEFQELQFALVGISILIKMKGDDELIKTVRDIGLGFAQRKAELEDSE